VNARLLELMQCPWCGDRFTVEPFEGSLDTKVVSGLLRSGCGRVFPIVRGIPRVLPDAFQLHRDFVAQYRDRLPANAAAGDAAADASPNADAIRRTRDSFGYQWTVFSEMATDFRRNFLNYIAPVEEAFFPGKLGMDLGCGFGRHIYNAAKFGAEMVGVDISDAIESTRVNTEGLPNVHLVQANVYQLPFKPGVFDFAYSIGVLHHLPEPEQAFQCVVQVVRPRGSVFVWVYSNSRRLVNFALESVRAVTTRSPKPVQQALSFIGAAIDWTGFIMPYRILSRMPIVGGVVRRHGLPRLKVYGEYPFQVVYADWFDRLAAPIRFYYDGDAMRGWLDRAHLQHTAISPTGLFGWRAYGERV
jgi:SAM-dependent methyltransferase